MWGVTEQRQLRTLGLRGLDKHNEMVDRSLRFGSQVEELAEVEVGEGGQLGFDILSLRYLWDYPVGRWKLKRGI